jgi:hypothetical protein
MMDKAFWEKIASFWTIFQSKEEKEQTDKAIESMFQEANNYRQEERSLAELLLERINSDDDEEDDDGY